MLRFVFVWLTYLDMRAESYTGRSMAHMPQHAL